MALTGKQEKKATTVRQGEGPKFANINDSSQWSDSRSSWPQQEGGLRLQTPLHGPGWLPHVPTALGLQQFSGIVASLKIILQMCRMNRLHLQGPPRRTSYSGQAQGSPTPSGRWSKRQKAGGGGTFVPGSRRSLCACAICCECKHSS